MSIIIETPQPPIRERLVLVREGEPMAPRRDATPEDLERAGWVRRGSRQDLDCVISDLTEQVRAAERERDDAMLFASRNAIDEYRKEGEARSDAIHRLAREREEARREAAKLDANLGKTLAAATAAGWDGIENPKAVWDFVAHLARERAEARAQAATLAAVVADAGRALAQAGIVSGGGLAEQVVRLARERDEARAALATWQGSAACLVTRAVEAGCDVTMAEHATHEGPGWYLELRSGPPVRSATARNVDAAYVTKELARLLGEVTRGR